MDKGEKSLIAGMPRIIGVPKESYPGENRVALTPETAASFIKADMEVLMEEGAGERAGYPDKRYLDKGVKIVQDRAELFKAASVILQVRTLGANPEAGREDLERMQPGQVVIGLSEPLTSMEETGLLAEAGVSHLSMELMPRITRAQNMDSLSSMATIAGYKAVLLATEALPRMFPMLMTAAGTLAPARVFVIGAGVAGLQAIATAKRLGAVVHAYDVRPAVKEQVESLGARFVELEIDGGDSEDKGGYAKAMDEEFYRKQREMMARVLAESDVVITTAAVPGKKAPILITREMVHEMAPGSVVVDIAAERGGNCELTRPGETVKEEGVTVLGPLNLPASVPYHASQMYAKNIANLLQLLDKNSGQEFDMTDEVIRETLVTRDGKIVHARIRELLGMDTLVPEGSEA